MAWIESHQSLAMHRKTLAAVRQLHVDRHKLIGHLHELWWWALENANPEGLMTGVSTAQIAAAAGWPSSASAAERFVGALLSCGGDGQAGFLELHEGTYQLHNWYLYAGKLGDQRELRRAANRRSQAKRRQRLRGADKSDSQSDFADNQHPTGPDLTGPNRTGPTPPLSPPDGQRLRAADEDVACCPQFAMSKRIHYQGCPNFRSTEAAAS